MSILGNQCLTKRSIEVLEIPEAQPQKSIPALLLVIAGMKLKRNDIQGLEPPNRESHRDF